MKFKNVYITTLVMLAIPTWGGAVVDLGTVGEVYPVKETDVRERLKQQAVETWDRAQKEYQEKAHTYQPANIHALPRAKEDRTFYVDMTYTLDRDLKDQDGRVLYPKGYTFNPLDYVDLHLGLVVIDGGDPAQVRWFKESPYRGNKRVKLLLSGGYAREIMRQLDRAAFYLDNVLAERLKLSAVPCVAVERDGKMMITEFMIEEERDEKE